MKNTLKKIAKNLGSAWTLILIVSIAYASILEPAGDSVHLFNQGDVISSGKINGNFEALRKRIAILEKNSVPSGAVMAFNLISCPDNWVPANGNGTVLQDKQSPT